MSMRSSLLIAAALVFAAGASAETPNLGQSITEADLALWDISVSPDGVGLPQGSGTAAQGKAVYEQKCELCHGKDALGGKNAALDQSLHQLHSVLGRARGREGDAGALWLNPGSPFKVTRMRGVVHPWPAGQRGNLRSRYGLRRKRGRNELDRKRRRGYDGAGDAWEGQGDATEFCGRGI